MNIPEALSVLVELKGRDELFIALTPPFYVSFEVDRTKLRGSLTEHGFEEEEFRKMADRIGMVLLNLLNKSPILDENEEVARLLGIDFENQIEVEAIQAYVSSISTGLMDATLQRRYDLKSNSKAPSFSKVDWDIKVKHHDASLDTFAPFPYATLRISFQRDFGDTPFAVFGGRAFDSVQINFSRDEIDYLSHVLSVASGRLAEMEEKL